MHWKKHKYMSFVYVRGRSERERQRYAYACTERDSTHICHATHKKMCISKYALVSSCVTTLNIFRNTHLLVFHITCAHICTQIDLHISKMRLFWWRIGLFWWRIWLFWRNHRIFGRNTGPFWEILGLIWWKIWIFWWKSGLADEISCFALWNLAQFSNMALYCSLGNRLLFWEYSPLVSDLLGL